MFEMKFDGWYFASIINQIVKNWKIWHKIDIKFPIPKYLYNVLIVSTEIEMKIDFFGTSDRNKKKTKKFILYSFSLDWEWSLILFDFDEITTAKIVKMCSLSRTE